MKLRSCGSQGRELIISYFDEQPEPKIINWSITPELDYIEEIMFDILEHLGVGLVCRNLFGLKLPYKSPWLAPNTTIKELMNLLKKHPKIFSPDPDLVLRMRFRPSCYSRLLRTDKRAFDIIFSQIKYDFIHTKFSHQPRSRILFNNSVLGLIATDLLRFALTKNIEPREALREANPSKFVPHRVMKWQRVLLFLFGDSFKINDSMKDIYASCKNDISKIKQGFIELFLNDVCPNYANEVYTAIPVQDNARKSLINVRLRYFQATDSDSNFVIESSPSRYNLKGLKRRDVSREWTQLCDIESLSSGTLRDNIVELSVINGSPIRFQLENTLMARSFLSCISGYYRLMKKWNFAFCKSVASPDLEKLRQMRCHGPIGYQSMLSKMTTCRPGTYLVRQCADKRRFYKVDMSLTGNRPQISVTVEWNPVEMKFVIVKIVNSPNSNLTLNLTDPKHSSLQSLINDIEIRSTLDSPKPQLCLKHWLVPIECDDCPSLLLSITKKRLVELIPKGDYSLKSTDDLPRVIPADYLKIVEDDQLLNSHNGLYLRKAKLSADQLVVVKYLDRGKFNMKPDVKHFMWNTPSSFQGGSFKLNTKLDRTISQTRLENWASIKHCLFAETIGVSFMGSPLIQEFFDKGTLDIYLQKSLTTKPEADALRESVVGQLTFAVVYLQEKKFIHGKIRCHNIFIHRLNPIKIKLSDPFGAIDPEEDKAFLPPVYFGLDGLVTLKEFDRSIDVWSLGTTIWQIFKNGQRPPRSSFAINLERPESCNLDTWSVIQSCWIVDPSCQLSSQTIYRDLKESLSWTLEVAGYHYIDNSLKPSDPNRSKSVSVSGDTSGVACYSSMVQLFETNNIPSETNFHFRSFKNPLSNVYFRNPMRRKTSRSSGSSVSFNSISFSELTQSTDIVATPSFDDLASSCDTNIRSLLKSLIIGPEIGAGSTGKVLRAQFGENGQTVALKFVYEKSREEDLKHEYEILRRLDNPYIIKVLGFFNEEKTILVSEYMNIGCLRLLLRNATPSQLMKFPKKRFCYEIATGMEYLESVNIVHCDLALRNILVDDGEHIKICDFGMAQDISEKRYHIFEQNKRLPLIWYPPETLENLVYTHKSDVWSCGIVMWEIYSDGCKPQYSNKYPNQRETLRNERLGQPENCPAEVYDLMLSCWRYEPQARCSFGQLKEGLEQLK